MTQSDPHSRAADAVHEGRPVEAQYVRQGRRGTHVMWILAVSLILVVTGFLFVWLANGDELASTEQTTFEEQKQAAPFAAPEPAGTTKQVTTQDPTAPARGSTDADQAPAPLPAETQSAQ